MLFTGRLCLGAFATYTRPGDSLMAIFWALDTKSETTAITRRLNKDYCPQEARRRLHGTRAVCIMVSQTCHSPRPQFGCSRPFLC